MVLIGTTILVAVVSTLSVWCFQHGVILDALGGFKEEGVMPLIAVYWGCRGASATAVDGYQ